MDETQPWIRNKVDEIAVERGCYFDQETANKVCQFFEKFLRHSKGKWAGKPFTLLPWQRDFLSRLYGWKRTDGTRRFREAYLEVPKKNGKSTLVSGIAIHSELEEPGAEVYIGAVNSKQAFVVYEECARMVNANPSFKKRFDIIPYKKRIEFKETNSFLTTLTADIDSVDGVSASCTILDEIHRYKTPKLYNLMVYAGAAREQPLLVCITTAGSDRTSICYERHDYARKVNSGIIEDIEFLGVIYAAEPEDDINDPKTWHKANPSLGITIKEEDFEAELKGAQASPTKLNNFLRLRLNLWVNEETRFLPRDKWDACGKEAISLDSLKGRSCVGAIDLSSVSDLTSLSLAFGNDDGIVTTLPFFWIPEDGAEERETRDRVPYVTWARQGFLEMTPGNVIDYDYIRARVNELAATYHISKIYIDPYNATQLAGQLDQDGIPIEFHRQGFVSMNQPTKELERLVLSGRLKHPNNPVLNWCCDNAIVETDAAGNIKISKSKSREKVDGLVSLVMALNDINTEEPITSGAIEWF